jgi:molybdopterin/thiamine biosynthesis adenylyltransferase
MLFREDQIRRYARHILLPEVGGAGQGRLLSARVLVVGAGGLGSPLLLYLAAAGIGTIGIVDDDRVDLSNLQRQIVHDMESIGRPKVDSASERLAAINPDVAVERHVLRLTGENAADQVARYDIVADGSDNFATRYLLNDVCFQVGRPLVAAAMLRFDAQISTFKAYLGPPHPCYRCIFREAPPPGLVPSCSEAGVIGALPGMVGSMQALEVVKELLGIGDGLSGRLILIDSLAGTQTEIAVARDPSCPLCGARPGAKPEGAASD